MVDLKVTVSAPGATKAADDIRLAAERARELATTVKHINEGTEAFNKTLEREAQLLTGKVSPALAQARKEAATYNALMSRGHLSVGRSYLAGSSLSMSGGPGGGGGRGPSLREMARPLGMLGGEFGQAAQLIGRSGMLLGSAMGGVVLGLSAGVLAIRHWLAAEEDRLAAVEEETKLRSDLNKTIKEAQRGQEDRAASQNEKDRSASQVIINRSRDAYEAQGRLAALEDTGDLGAKSAMAKFLKTKMGKQMTYDGAFSLAKDTASTGEMSFSEALGAMGGLKGNGLVTVGRILGEKGKGNFSEEALDEMRRKQAEYDDLTGQGELDRSRRERNAVLGREGRDVGLASGSVERSLMDAVNPVGVATEKFRKALDDSLEPLRARAAAENEIIKAYKESALFRFLFNSKSEGRLLEDKEKTHANGLR